MSLYSCKLWLCTPKYKIYLDVLCLSYWNKTDVICLRNSSILELKYFLILDAVQSGRYLSLGSYLALVS